MAWAPAWGMKGAIDAVVELIDEGNDMRFAPLELKTGRKGGSYLAHRAQVILYTPDAARTLRGCSLARQWRWQR